MIGKDEVSSSNLDSSSKIKARNHLVLGLFVLFPEPFWRLLFYGSVRCTTFVHVMGCTRTHNFVLNRKQYRAEERVGSGGNA